MLKRLLVNLVALAFGLLAFGVFGCSGGGDDSETSPLALAEDGELRLAVVLEDSASGPLREVAEDFLDACRRVAGAPGGRVAFESDAVDSPLRVTVDWTDTGELDYRISIDSRDGEPRGLIVEAATDAGMMHGLYAILADLGVRFFHPEESYYPLNSRATLPTGYGGSTQSPHFKWRGFHEHTQHPIEMSDFLLRPGEPGFRDYLSRYIRWLARNRQNMASFHMLKTVNLDAWLPYIADYIEEANSYGVNIGMVIGFADQQQNAFRMIREDVVDPATGEMVPEDEQIRQSLDRLLAAGFNFLGFQIGTSEFSKPEDAQALHWLDVAVSYLKTNYSDVRPYGWIHTTCDLKSDDGGYYYHIPEKADSSLGAFVHTTMFYTLGHPAPVYECDNFDHQLDFIERNEGKRELVYFPETAWWLGFDNNAPVVLPITGWSRDYDIRQVLKDRHVAGHVTFTTGREWTYWMYDHYLTRVTWDGKTSWSEYLDWIAPVFGPDGQGLVQALKDWTDLQVKHFYEEQPEIYFYLAGELPQDEIGAQAGILARRPKIAFKEVLNYDAAVFAAWKARDYDMLSRMREEYAAALEGLPDAPADGSDQQKKLYAEARNGLDIYLMRLDHTLALYDGVILARIWAEESKSETPDEADRDSLLAAANDKLDEAQSIGESAIEIFTAMEKQYRYPVELLCREKPETLTSYPYGYLYETSTGYFWTRREQQLATLIGQTFGTLQEEWQTEPETLFYTDDKKTQLTFPEDPLAGGVIKSFIPQLLFGLKGYDSGSGALTLVLAQDYNANFKPDPESELSIPGRIDGGSWEGRAEAYTIVVHDSAGEEIGALTVIEPIFAFGVTISSGAVSALDEGSLTGEITSAGLIALIMSVGGIDEEGAGNLIKSIYGYAAEEPLPVRLSMAFAFEFERAN
ncbi:MAG: hypothetical protein C4523_21090 [Myxococcales bacterium]|nr:MAG: hypothetical protein C4523_21090 [Myxococcales bacterium]